MPNLYLSTIRATIKAFPAVVPYLKGRARWVVFADLKSGRFVQLENPFNVWNTEYKSYEYFLSTLERLVKSVYEGNVGGDFIDVMANLISGQLTQAYQQAWDEQGDGDAMPDYLTSSLEELILSQYGYVDQYYRDIVDARIDETPIEPLIVRATLWANRWTEAYNQALHLITVDNEGNEEWVLGETETHCPTCSQLNGIVARASEWEELGVHPQQAPNDLLDCGGWQCDCSRQPTDKRRTRGGYNRIQEIVKKG